MRQLQYKKVAYHKGLRGSPARIATSGKSKCPAISEAEAERLLNAGHRDQPDENGFPGRVFVHLDGQWYKAHGGKEGHDGPYYHAFPVEQKDVPSKFVRAQRRSPQ